MLHSEALKRIRDDDKLDYEQIKKLADEALTKGDAIDKLSLVHKELPSSTPKTRRLKFRFKECGLALTVEVPEDTPLPQVAQAIASRITTALIARGQEVRPQNLVRASGKVL